MTLTLRTKKLADGAFSYYLDYYDNGKRKREKILTVKKEDDKKEFKRLAENIRNQKALELAHEGTGFVPDFRKNIDVVSYSKKFVESYKKADNKVLSSSLIKFKDFLSAKKLPQNISFKQFQEKIVIDFADYLNYEAGLSGSTPLNYFKKFKMILTEAKAEKLIETSFLVGYRFRSRTEDTEKRLKKNVLSEEEINLLWKTECSNEEIKKAFLYGCYTGLGYAEIASLKWSNIEDNILNTKRKKNNRRINNMISERMMIELGKRKKDDDYVFNLTSKKTGQPYTTNGVNLVIKKLIKKAGINRHFTFYCARHTFAVRLLNNKADLKTVANAMGHTNTLTTNKYLNHIDHLKHNATSSLM